MDIIRISCEYQCSVDIICISRILSAFRRYCPHLVDTIVIGHITSYLDPNVCHVLHSFVLVVDIIFGLITSYLAHNVHPIFH